MTTVAQVEPKLVNFKTWLNERGAEILAATNSFELLRFRTPKGVSVVYFKKTGQITFVGESEAAWNAFRYNQTWRALPATPRKKGPSAVKALRERDGDLCFYCQAKVFESDETQEHLVSLAHGGPNHISNLFLAHKICNESVGNLSAVEKIKIHVSAVMRVAADNLKAAYARTK